MTAYHEVIDHEAVREYLASVLPARLDGYDQPNPGTLGEMARAYLGTLADELGGDPAMKTAADRIRYDVDAGTWEWRTWQRSELAGAWLGIDPEALRESGEADTCFRDVVAAEVLALSIM